FRRGLARQCHRAQCRDPDRCPHRARPRRRPMVPSSLAIIAKAYPRDERGGAIGIWSSASSFFTIAGPVVGGLVLTALGDWSWRLVFAVNLPLGIAALALLFL